MWRLQAAAVAQGERPSGMQDWEQLGLHATTAEEAQWVKDTNNRHMQRMMGSKPWSSLCQSKEKTLFISSEVEVREFITINQEA